MKAGRPLSASTGGFLDDLFVDPTARGSGAADALIAALADEGRKQGWTVIRWITAEDNYRARALYEGRLAPSIDDVHALAEPVLEHRMALTFPARAEGMTVRDVIASLVSDLRK